jgi:two-component system CheB/CheR fusion protein
LEENASPTPGSSPREIPSGLPDAPEAVGRSSTQSAQQLSDAAPAAPSLPVRIVGIGASAGGLEALRVLVSQLPIGLGACYAIAQHLSPSHRSMLVDLLARETSLRVLEISHGMLALPDVVYVAPASCHVRVLDGRFQLETTTQPGIPKPSVDAFFESLAVAFEDRAVGIVLSGTGSDGARGVRAIRAAGGCTLTQDPGEAKYDGMPRGAIETGCIDFIDPVSQMGPHLSRLLSATDFDQLPATTASADGTEPLIDSIVQTVRRRAGFDLSLYKPRPLERRIRRRVAATESGTLEAYISLLNTSSEEVDRVVREMFISVTQFFRDTEAFESLNRHLGALLAEKPSQDELRIWVPGCATGEEAYSLAMLVAEHFDGMQRWPNVRIFATDLDLNALSVARRGVYALNALNEVPARLAEKYLVVDSGVCRIGKRLREMVIFSEHNLLRDPAFLRLDLVSCRNLLIYLQPEVHQRLMSSFAHALRPGGLLFLGKAEALHARTELFTVLEGQGQIFRATGAVLSGRASNLRPIRALVRPTGGADDRKRWEPGAWLARAHDAGLLPPLVLADDDGMVRHMFGDVSPYLRLGSGGATLELVALAAEPVRLPLRSTLLKTQREPGKRVTADVPLDDGGRNLRLVAWRREEPGSPPLTLVMFDEREGLRASSDLSSGEERSQHHLQRVALESQLTATRDHLSTVISELESANEELQSLNEEMQSANEELQSANEELETSNEELQSTNEELITVNEELESRTAELSLLNADLHNVKNSLADPIIVVDEHRRVTLFNPTAVQIFALDQNSIGALLFSLPTLIDLGPVAPIISQVIADGAVAEHQLSGERCYMMRIQPYLDAAGHCKGAVLTFTENTALLRTTLQLADTGEQLRQAVKFASATIEAMPKKIGVIDAQGLLVKANLLWRQAAARKRPLSLCCAEGENYLLVCQHAQSMGDEVAGAFVAGLRAVMRGERTSFEQESTCASEPLVESAADPLGAATRGLRHLLTTVTPFSPDGGSAHWVITVQDVTQHKQQALQILLQAKALNASVNPITICDATLPDMPLVYVNSAFEAMTGYDADEVLGLNCRLLQGADRNQAGLNQIRQALAVQQGCRVLLRNYRKDGTLFWNELTLSPIVENGRLTHVVGLQRDMTVDLASEKLLKASLQRESQALAFAGLGSLEWDIRDATIGLSDRHARLMGLPGERSSLTFGEFRALISPDDQPLFDEAAKLCVAGHSSLDIEYRVVWPDGTHHWLHTLGNVVIDGRGVATQILGLSQDVTSRKDNEDRVRFIAHHDALTGLPNRALLRDRCQLALNSARRNRSRLAMMFIDLDHFKDINDSLGHEAGDSVLVMVAERLRVALRDTDTVCRQSGDEFIVLLPGVRDANDAVHLAEKLVDSIAMPHKVMGQELRVTCSAGLSLYPDDGNTRSLV